MSRQLASRKRSSKERSSRRRKALQETMQRQYGEACRLAVDGQLPKAKLIYERLKDTASDAALRALVKNDLAALSAADGDVQSAIKGLQLALTLDPNCEPARLNLALLEVDRMFEGGGQRLLSPGAPGAESQRQNKGERPETKVENREPVGKVEGRELSASESRRAGIESQTELPKCLVLMITYNRLEYTKLALDAVLQLDYPELEIVVWDNASTDGTVEFLKGRLNGLSNVRLVLSETNRGVVYAMNAIWSGEHDAEVLAKVDNDTLVPPELLRRLAECHVRSNHYGALSGFHFRKEGEAIADGKNVLTLNGACVFRQRFVGGCAIMIRKEVLQQIGPIPSRTADPSPPPLSPQARRGEDRPFMDGGWTWYQQRLDELGYINGYPWPFVHVDHMEDTRSQHCVRTQEHRNYKQAMRGMSLEEFTQELCVWRPH